MARVKESGHIYFFYRPRVQRESAAGLEEIQRFHLILNPRHSGTWRVITIGRKRLPRARESGAGERLWAYVARVARSPDEIEHELDGYAYATKTRGERVQGAARPAGEGVYCLLDHDRHTHLAYALEFPRRTGEVQEELRIEPRGSFVMVVKNPEAPAPPLAGLSRAQSAVFPRALQERFRGRRYAEVDPEFLDRPGAELILIATRGLPEEALEGALAPEEEEGDAAIFRELHLEPREHPLGALFEGEWS